MQSFTKFKERTARKLAVLSFVVCSATACQLTVREQIIHELENANWSYDVKLAQDFYLFRAGPKSKPQNKIANIVIEGDGKSWLTRFRPSPDPSPQNPVGLKIAKKLKGFSIYIARPCQYVDRNQQRNCHPVMWTNARFAPEVISSLNVAINQVKQEFGIKNIRIFGFSGGGVLAALIAAKRNDIVELVTIAAPLDIDYWAKYHDVSPLRNSLNPMDQAHKWSTLPQWHFAGGEDDVVPVKIYSRALRQILSKSYVSLSVLPEYDHTCCWEEYFRDHSKW